MFDWWGPNLDEDRQWQLFEEEEGRRRYEQERADRQAEHDPVVLTRLDASVDLMYSGVVA